MLLFKTSQFEEIDPVTDDQLAEAEALATREQALEKLKDRFAVGTKRSWLVRNHSNRRTAHYFSYLSNLISALAGLYGARILFQFIPMPLPYADYLIALGFLFVMEKYKRKFSDKLWDAYFSTKKIILGYASANLALFLLSLGLSAYGVYFAAKDFSPEAKYIGGGDNIEVVALQDQLQQQKDKLQGLLDDPSSYNSEGQFYYKLMDTRNALEGSIATLTATLQDKHGVINLQNKDILADWQFRNAFRGKFSIIITVLAELLFEICMAFGRYYDYRYCRALIASRKTKSGSSGKMKALVA